MKRVIEYPVKDFYIGELYLYHKFGNLLTGSTAKEGRDKIKKISESGAINFQSDLASKYIDWENKREYIGFLTIFFKQDDKYICLHDGKVYQLNSPYIIDNLVPLNDLLPKIDANSIPRISMYQALELFDILFKEECPEKNLYIENNKPISDFFIGDLALREITPVEIPDSRIQYINLPHQLMLEKSNLKLYSFEDLNYINSVYRCLFLRDGVDLYNINNHQFYNPSEDQFDKIIPFKTYMTDLEVKTPSKSISIPKALKLFKKTI